MTSTAPPVDTTPSIGLASNFSLASTFVICGVLAGWIWVKMSSAPIQVSLPEVSTFSRADREVQTSMLEQAELAFVAGRLTKPINDNALYYYQLHLEREPGSIDAQNGINKIMSYLLDNADNALFRNDWTAAREDVRQVLAIMPEHAAALDTLARVDDLEAIEALLAKAAEQIAANDLADNGGDNAIETYRAVLAIDRNNDVARRGLETIAGRFVANAQSAAFAGDVAVAESFIDRAREVSPNTAGIDEAERLVEQWRELAVDQTVQHDLNAAAQALRAGRLVAPSGQSARDLFRDVLAAVPNSEAAKRGLELVASGLVDRARTRLDSGDSDGARRALDAARETGADPRAVREVLAEIDFEGRLAAARSGRFDEILSLQQLEVVRRVPAEYPRNEAQRGIEGWANVQFTVSEAGDPVDAVVTDASARAFERSALAAIRQWRFEPHVEQGRTMPVRSSVKFTFQPED